VRVGISLLTLVPSVSGGSEMYARGLVSALADVGTLDYTVLLPTIAADVDGPGAVVVPEYRASRSTPGRLRAMASASVGRRVRGVLQGFDALHFPLTVMIPPLRRPPAATTINDVQHEFLPEFFSWSERMYRRRVYAWSARLSRIVVAISRHGAASIIERLRVPEERVRVIHYGLDHDRFRPGEDPREELLVYPALGWPHKNHARLFEAFGVLRESRPHLRLLLPGYAGDAPDGVEALGWTAPDELASLYRRSAAVVFPSLFEGFGQPPLEAMASGCPVACSNAASLPEVCGDAAELFDPRSVEQMIAAVERVLDDPGPYRERGLRQAALFTWTRCAREHETMYRELLT
jgi:glycosyltransferase involved in cell wall biosynthesis